jgi:hypothetical protein
MGQIDFDGSNSTVKADIIRGQTGTTVKLGGLLDTDGNYIQTEKGGDLTSASPLVIDTDGDYFDVTGTVSFAAMTVAADRQFTLQFDGALTMTHHATNLDLPGEANITTAAGDVATFQSTGANTVQCISYVKADGTAVVGSVEGTAVLSTGEAGGTKYLREDGDGTSSWQTAGGGGWIELQSISPSAVSSLDLETGIGSTYTEYMIKFANVYPSTDDGTMEAILKVGGSYQTADYKRHTAQSQDTATTYSGNAHSSDSKIQIAFTFGNATGEGANGTIFFGDPTGTDNFKALYNMGQIVNSAGNMRTFSGAGVYTGAVTALTGVRLQMNTGNFSSGEFTLYGLTKA